MVFIKNNNGIVNRKIGQIEFDIFDLLDNKNSLMKGGFRRTKTERS